MNEDTKEELAEQTKWEAQQLVAKASYLDLARQNQELMKMAIHSFHPYYVDPDFGTAFSGEITAQRAEDACAVVRREIKRQTTEDPVKQYLEYDADVIVSIANAVWFGMPESMESRNHPAFGIVCELAEGY